jgi:8-oxo-dGTP pyrophosphatase MutT (NUDIX family)
VALGEESCETGREEILSELAHYVAIDIQDDERKSRFVDFVQSEPICCSRELKKGHLTGSAWVVNQAKTHVLLLHHRKLGKWLQPGGHADGDFNLRRVAEREVREETGVTALCSYCEDIFDLDIHEIPERGDEPAHLHYDIRFAFITAAGEEQLTSNHESNGVRWVEISRLEEFTKEESILRMRLKWLARTPAASQSPSPHPRRS